MGAQVFVEFARGEHQQEFFAHRLGAAALGTVEFGGGEGSELVRHADYSSAIKRRISRSTFTGVWVASMICTTAGP